MRLIIALCLLSLAGCHADRESRSAQADIRVVMKREWDRPDAPLTVEPIIVRGAVAIAVWTQPALGGRALLQREGDSWRVVLCAGDELKDARLLEQAGVSRADAAALLQALAEAERPLTAERLARVAAFKGVMRMQSDGSGTHAP